ncbi:hypothetical protein EJ04DRAFT_569922 [Polyplosphaeria fusca]|uniref:Lysine-specific metallo-endopeptidase domain-containing protein n=1 Tax=Polyplosphaeria fusca TaxID=682080 RepID=A0A9P4QN27_9PLEO|nr:hypothetical protein EJ04DRAFT_569922 [Polyplosphaeria fusca]
MILLPLFLAATSLLFQPTSAIPTPDSKTLLPRSVVYRGSFAFQNCDDGHITRLQIHIQDAERLALQAYAIARPGNRYYDAFFGTDPDFKAHPNDAELRERFKLLSTIRSARNVRSGSDGYFTLRCDAEGAPDKACLSTSRAPMMTVWATGEMFVCRSFWAGELSLSRIAAPVPQQGMQSLDTFSPTGGYILHELTHVIWFTNDQLLRNGAKMYAHEYTLRGVQEAGWHRGRTNADNYRMFATAAYWGSRSKAKWSVDPDKITTGRDGL